VPGKDRDDLLSTRRDLLDDLPNSDVKRRLLHDERTPPETLNELADGYREAGRLGEALECLERTGDETRLGRLREDAVSRGEVFVLAQTERLLEDHVDAKAWRDAAEAALADGRLAHARTAFERAGDEVRAEEVAVRMPAVPKGHRRAAARQAET
jgi:tetratricopeptide (TPR) repeat protein